MIDELAKARLKRQREVLDKAERWTPRDAIDAVIADMELGELQRVECVTVVISYETEEGGASHITRYTGSNGQGGPKQTFWVMGMIAQCLHDWMDK